MSAPSDGDVIRVVLYGRAGCHLCEQARGSLLEIRREGIGFDLVEIDIDSDDELHRRLLERIPVIEIGGREVCELGIDRDAVKARLASL